MLSSVQCYSLEDKGKLPKDKLPPKPKPTEEERAELARQIEANKRTHERRRLRARAKGGKGINRNCQKRQKAIVGDVPTIYFVDIAAD